MGFPCNYTVYTNSSTNLWTVLKKQLAHAVDHNERVFLQLFSVPLSCRRHILTSQLLETPLEAREPLANPATPFLQVRVQLGIHLCDEWDPRMNMSCQHSKADACSQSSSFWKTLDWCCAVIAHQFYLYCVKEHWEHNTCIVFIFHYISTYSTEVVRLLFFNSQLKPGSMELAAKRLLTVIW